MDGQFDKLEELIYVESHMSNTSAKFYGEITQQVFTISVSKCAPSQISHKITRHHSELSIQNQS